MTRANSSVSSGNNHKRVLGWREWVSLPGLGIVSIKAKLDTGAKTSALHAWDISPCKVDGRQWIRFRTHPLQRDKETSTVCEAPLSDRRWVTNSSGSSEHRYIIVTELQIGASRWPIELSLTNREAMGFPMIIGREAMRNRVLVDPRASYRAGRHPTEAGKSPSNKPDSPRNGGIN